MSKSWARGSSPRWRALRLFVWDRDQGVCGLCHEPIPPSARKPHPLSYELHHTRRRELVGDDPQWLLATHRKCNLAAGQPGRDEAEHTVPDWLATRLKGR